MSAQNTTNWIRVGLFTLPLSGVLIAWSSLDPQPDQVKHPEEWARFVGSSYYLLTHIFGSIGSALLVIFGVFALSAYLAGGRAGRLGLVAMVITVVGQALSLVIGGVSTFASNAIGRAYLAGTEDVMRMEFSTAMSVLFGLAILLLVVGNVLLGVAVWRSGTLPKWAGAIWVASALLFYVLGAVLGMATKRPRLSTLPLPQGSPTCLRPAQEHRRACPGHARARSEPLPAAARPFQRPFPAWECSPSGPCSLYKGKGSERPRSSRGSTTRPASG